jgi:hypothetical protein
MRANAILKSTLALFILFITSLLLCVSCSDRKYVNIKTTKLLIIPPPGFHEEPNFVGLKKDKNSMIEVSDYDRSYSENLINYSKEVLEMKGGLVLSYENARIDGYPGKLVHVKLDDVGKAWFIIFGDSSFFSTVLGPYNLNDEDMGSQIKEALLSVKYDKKIKTGRTSDNAIFKLYDQGSIFKLAKSASNVFIYSVGGVNKGHYGLEPSLIAHHLPNQERSPRWIIDYMKECLAKEGYENIIPDNEYTDPINGYDAAECELHCSLNGQNAVMYHAAFVHGDKAVTIQGLCFSDFDNNIKEFKKLAYTIKFEN